MAWLQTDTAATSCKPMRQLERSRSWRQLVYRLARRGIGLQLAQVRVCDLSTAAESRWDNKYEFCQLDADDVCRLAADPANDLTSDMGLRLADGNRRCFAALDGAKLACYVWCGEGLIGPEDTMGIPLSLAADACYIFKAFAVPSYRGRGIYMLTAKRALLELRQLGKMQGIALIEYGNVASMRSHDRIGLKPQGWIVSLGWGGFAWRWYASATRQCGFGHLA